MKFAVVGSHYLSPEETKTVRFLLDAVFCRYATGNPILLTAGRPGVETEAAIKANKWNWAAALEAPTKNHAIALIRNRILDTLLVENCDVMICIQRRFDNHSRITSRVRKMGKAVWEYYV
jgi:hypothetical protein